MATRRYMASLLVLYGMSLVASAVGDEVLPSLSAEKMSEYKNAFGKAISESRDSGGRERPVPRDGRAPHDGKGPPPGGGLSNFSKQLREHPGDHPAKGPGPGKDGPDGRPPFDKGPRGDGARDFPGGHDGMRPPPGFGGPGQPGGPPPGGPRSGDGSKGP